MDGGIGKRAVNKLGDRQVRAFVARAVAGKKLSDGGGLFLTISAAGTPLWRVKYRFDGKEQLYSIGAYPSISLDAARSDREWVKEQLRAGRNPVQQRDLNRRTNAAAAGKTFESVAKAWLKKQQPGWVAIHYEKSKRAIERDVLPVLGSLPVADITPVLVSSVIEAIDKRGARDTAAKILQHVVAVFRLAQARGLCRDNPAAPVREVLSRRKSVKRRPALLDFKSLGGVLREAQTARVSPSVRLAHRLCAFSVARISNVVQAEWNEFDLDAVTPTWVIPRDKMKVKSGDRTHDHKVILGPSITAELRAWSQILGSKGYLFPSPSGDGHITRESIEKYYRVTLGLEGRHTPHGWRAAFSTLARDHGFERDAVELALDHIHDNDVARVYDRGERLKERIRMAHWWDAELAQAERGADVVELKQLA